MTQGYIHTIGDSTLDNLFWMLGETPELDTAKQNTVEGQLQKHVDADGLKVVSHAYDGFTTRSVLNGDRIGALLPSTHELKSYIAEKAPHGLHVFPLAKLQQKISEAPNARHFVVISVGGNDFRANLSNPFRLLKDIPQIQKRYLEIVKQVKSLKGQDIRPILMMQYRTDANHDPYLIYTLLGIMCTVAVLTHITCLALLTAPLWVLAGKVSLLTGGIIFLAGATGLYLSTRIAPLSLIKDIFTCKKFGMATLNRLIHAFYQPILTQAKKDRLPVLDLPNTFNPYKPLYISGIEPNKEGGALIADMIAHVVKNHDFRGPSKIYSKPSGGSGYHSIENTNPPAWTVAYFS